MSRAARIREQLERGPLGLGLILAVALLVVPVRLNLPTEVPVQEQVRRMNPDAKLYYSLAVNLATGEGYVDTFRNKEVMPTIGHPLILAVACVELGLSPARLAWLSLWLSILALALATRIYCGSNLFVLATVALFGFWLSGVRWLSGNVETSIVLTSSLLVLCLAIFFRRDFSLVWAGVAGLALAANLLVRPLYLYPMQAALLGTLTFAGVHWFRRRPAPLPRALRGWTALLVTTQILFAGVGLISQLGYGDSRLVTGTYGGVPLYVANNIHLRPDAPFVDRAPRTPEFQKMIDFSASTAPWREKQAILVDATLEYWGEEPTRALRGVVWRFQRFLGLHSATLSRPAEPMASWLLGPRSHALFVLALIGLLGLRAWQAGRSAFAGGPTLGVVVAALFGLYAGIHAVFVYVNFRHVTSCGSLLAASVVFLAFEAAGRSSGKERKRERSSGRSKRARPR